MSSSRRISPSTLFGKRASKGGHNWRSAIARLEGAYSENTLRAYRADFGLFENWCKKARRSALPASPETIAAFVAHDAIKSSPSTLRRRLAGIRKVHRLLRLANPVEDEDVLIAMRRALRTKPRRQKQAHGLTRELRDKLLAACPDTLLGLRNRALVAVGYDTLCRRAELVSLRVEDLAQLENGAMSVLVRRAKNDPFGDGRYGYITARTVQILNAWLEAASIKKGWLFRKVSGRQIGSNPLHPYTVNLIIKGAADAAGLDPDVVQNLSGHSMRVGAAQDLMTDGVGLLPIMRAGGWKSTNIIGRYVEHTEIALLGQMRRSIGSGVSHSRRVTDPRRGSASPGDLSAQLEPG
jgi:site-specific recombinase XerD